MSVKIKCPVCDGEGKVHGDFGGADCGRWKKITCPACSGTGMQTIGDDCYRKWQRCRGQYIPYIPWTPCYPQPQPWYTTTQTGWTITGTSSCGGLNLSQSNDYNTVTTDTVYTTG